MRTTRIRSFALCALALAALSGCKVPGFHEGGSRNSDDVHVYRSYPHLPKTVSLVDIRTGETIWTVDVPVGKQLVLRFNDDDEYPDDPNRPAMMEWDIMDGGRILGSLSNSLPVPHWTSRRIDWTTRTAPELEQELRSGTEPVKSGT